jgi:transcriptional regulator with XRE-family HTH domain
MLNLYNRIAELCTQNNVSITTMCRESGVSRASLSDLKVGRKQGLSSDTLQKIASYFGVPSDYFIGTPPFDCWEEINQNRSGFLQDANVSGDMLLAMFGIDLNDPDSATAKSFIDFLSMAVISAVPSEDGHWEVELKPAYRNKKMPAGHGEQKIKLDDFTYAMHNHSGDLSEKDKSILLSMAEQLAAANRKRKQDEKTD